MKRIFISFALAAGVLSMSSCEKFLTEVPKSSLVVENSFKTEADWQKALTGVYAMLQQVFVGKETIVLNEFGTDEVEPFDLGYAAYQELKSYTFNPSHEFFRCHYIWTYDGIKRANTVLDMPASAPVSATTRNLMQAQAKFLRAVYYFDLVTFYGGVPKWTSSQIDPEHISLPRSSADEIYSLIISDLTSAASVLPEKWAEKSDYGRATSLACYAFLGRVYLQKGDAANARTVLAKLDGKFSLYDNLNDIFLPAHKNEFKENIFEVQFCYSGNWGLEGSIQSSYWGPRGGGGPTAGGFGWGGFGATQYLYDQYETSDKRKEAWFCKEYEGVVQNPPCIMKYRDPEHNNEIEDDNLNYILIRYADVLLMQAEACARIGGDEMLQEAHAKINQVRSRAGLSSLGGLNQTEMLDAILRERLLELCCEHHRRTDLIRFGKLAQQVKAAFPELPLLDSHFNLYPIPQQAIDSNEMMSDKDQNPGY